MDRLDAMRVLVAAADQGSLASAARVLERSPAAVSRAIAFLERQVGSQLLYRSSRNMRLSSVGEGYVSACRSILAQVHDADLSASEDRAAPQGILTLSAEPFAGEELLRPIVEEFLRAHPSVRVRVLSSERDARLIDQGLDVALRVGALPDSSLISVRVGAGVRNVVAAAPKYLATRPPIAQPSDLASHDIIARGGHDLQTWTFAPASGSPASRAVTLAPRVIAGSDRAALAAALDGLGVTRLHSYHLASAVRDGALEVVLADAETPPMAAHLVLPPLRNSVPKVRAFLDLAVPRLRVAFSLMSLPDTPPRGEDASFTIDAP